MLAALRMRSPAVLRARALPVHHLQASAAAPALFWQGEKTMAELMTSRKRYGMKHGKRKARLAARQARKDARPKISQFKFDTFTNHILPVVDHVAPAVSLIADEFCREGGGMPSSICSLLCV